MTRIQWHACWDALRLKIQTKTSWGKNEILNEMNEIERLVVRRAEVDAILLKRLEKDVREAGRDL